MAEYFIAFDTKEMKPNIIGWRVTLSKEVIRDMDKPLPINLCEDPLYPMLVRYVESNPLVKK
jgi:hypothetical protein